MIADIILGTSLDADLAPLDGVARQPHPRAPTPAEAERAYTLALIAAQLVRFGSSPYLLDEARRLGVETEDALTVARAFSSAIVRVAQTLQQG